MILAHAWHTHTRRPANREPTEFSTHFPRRLRSHSSTSQREPLSIDFFFGYIRARCASAFESFRMCASGNVCDA